VWTARLTQLRALVAQVSDLLHVSVPWVGQLRLNEALLLLLLMTTIPMTLGQLWRVLTMPKVSAPGCAAAPRFKSPACVSCDRVEVLPDVSLRLTSVRLAHGLHVHALVFRRCMAPAVERGSAFSRGPPAAHARGRLPSCIAVLGDIPWQPRVEAKI
jgi:hypothetical protein